MPRPASYGLIHRVIHKADFACLFSSKRRLTANIVRQCAPLSWLPPCAVLIPQFSSVSSASPGFETCEVFEELGAVAVEIMLGQVALIKAGQDGGQILQGEQLWVKRINERADLLRQLLVGNTRIASFLPTTCCWCLRFWSVETNTSNCPSASRSRSPFFNPPQPTSCAVLTEWSGRSRRKGRGVHASSRILTLRTGASVSGRMRARPPLAHG